MDTFLFLCFDLPQPLNATGNEWLKLQIRIPEQQPTHSELLVILRDKNGVEYLANTGVPLDSPGERSCYLRTSGFQRAGWSQQAGELDFSAITTVRLGWGGYLGAEGETVEFAAAPPRFVHLTRSAGA